MRHVVKLPLPAFAAQQDLVPERDRDVLDRDEPQIGTLRPLDQDRQVLVFPTLLPGQVRRVELKVVAAALLDEPQPRFGEVMELPQPHSHGKVVEVDHGAEHYSPPVSPRGEVKCLRRPSDISFWSEPGRHKWFLRITKHETRFTAFLFFTNHGLFLACFGRRVVR